MLCHSHGVSSDHSLVLVVESRAVADAAVCADKLMMTTTMLQAKALYANSADTEEELSFSPGDVLTVHERDVAGLAGWWLCSHSGRIGIAPGNRLRLLTATSDGDVVSSRHDDQQTTTNAGKQETSSTTKTRPATAPLQRGHTTQNGDNAKNKVRIEVKSNQICLIQTTDGGSAIAGPEAGG